MSDPGFLYKIARSYYLDGMTQQQVAENYAVSRIKVSRLLQEAREKGIVVITLQPPDEEMVELESLIARKTGLKEVILVSSNSSGRADIPADESIHNAMGNAASLYLNRVLKAGDTISLSWGRSLYAFVQYVKNPAVPDVKVVQMLGGLGSPEAEIHGSDLVRKLSARIGGTGRILSAPGIVRTPQVCSELKNDPHIAQSLENSRNSDIAFIGIGVSAPDSVLIREGQILSSEEAAHLKEKGAVGDVGLRFFDNDGMLIEDPINERVVGLDFDEIKAIPVVVGIAGGEGKRNAILAALKGRLVNVLVTDISTGRWLAEIL